MKKIIAFSKYIFYSVGGAEKSMFEVLKRKSAEQYEINLVGVENLKSFNCAQYEIPGLIGWSKTTIALKSQFKKFAYLEYCLNKGNITNYFRNINVDVEVYTYGFYAPAAVLGFGGKSTVYLRNETDLGINSNYYSGVKRIFKLIHIFLEYPFYLIYLRDLRVCYSKSKLVFNSQWMASECKKRFGNDGVIEYPIIDEELLKKNYLLNKNIQEKGIVFIGDSEIKGLSIVKKISRILNNQRFYVFSRNVKEKFMEQNITYMPWSTDNSIPFQYAKLIIVPSLWNEAFGRVSVEAQSLNIPVLVSNRGGLPETVKFNKKYIVEDFFDAKQWVKKINEVLL